MPTSSCPGPEAARVELFLSQSESIILLDLIDVVVDTPQFSQAQQADRLQSKAKESIIADLEVIPDQLLPWIRTVLHLHLASILFLVQIVEALLDDLNQVQKPIGLRHLVEDLQWFPRDWLLWVLNAQLHTFHGVLDMDECSSLFTSAIYGQLLVRSSLNNEAIQDSTIV